MRFSLAESMIEPTMYAPLVRAAEEAGYDSFVVPDSICYPEEGDNTYPYTADGSREFLEGKPFIEPFSLIPALAAVTEKIRFTTFVVKLPVRHPVLVAKQVTSVGVITGGRFGFGVGTSPWREDYAITQVPWERRGARMDECIEIIRGLQTGDQFGYSGEFYDFPACQLCPVPNEAVPILVGGPEGVERLEAAGVTDCIVGFRDAYQPGPDPQTLDEKLTAMQWYADEVIAKFR